MVSFEFEKLWTTHSHSLKKRVVSIHWQIPFYHHRILSFNKFFKWRPKIMDLTARVIWQISSRSKNRCTIFRLWRTKSVVFKYQKIVSCRILLFVTLLKISIENLHCCLIATAKFTLKRCKFPVKAVRALTCFRSQEKSTVWNLAKFYWNPESLCFFYFVYNWDQILIVYRLYIVLFRKRAIPAEASVSNVRNSNIINRENCI